MTSSESQADIFRKRTVEMLCADMLPSYRPNTYTIQVKPYLDGMTGSVTQFSNAPPKWM